MCSIAQPPCLPRPTPGGTNTVLRGVGGRRPWLWKPLRLSLCRAYIVSLPTRCAQQNFPWLTLCSGGSTFQKEAHQRTVAKEGNSNLQGESLGKGGGYEADQLPCKGPPGRSSRRGGASEGPRRRHPAPAPLPASREGPLRLPESRLELGRSRGKEAPAQSAARGRRESRQDGRGSWGRARWSRGLGPQQRLGARCMP